MSMYLNPVSPTSLAFFTSLKDYRRLSTDFRLTDNSPYVMPLNDIGAFRGKDFQKLPTLKYSPLVKSMTGHMGSVASRGQVTDHTFRFASGFVGTKSQSCREEVTVDVGSLLLPFFKCLAPLPADGSEAKIFQRDVSHNKNLQSSTPLPVFAKFTQPQCRATDVCEDHLENDIKKEAGSATVISGNEWFHAAEMVNCKEVVSYPSDKPVIKSLACEEPNEPSSMVLNVSEEAQKNEPVWLETAGVTHVTGMMEKNGLFQSKKLPTFNCNILRRSRLQKKFPRKIGFHLPRGRCMRDFSETCHVDNGKLNHEKGAVRYDPLGIKTSQGMPGIIDSAVMCTELLDFNKLPLQTGYPHFVSEGVWSGVVDSDWEVQGDSRPTCAEMPALAFTASTNQDVFCQNAAIAFIIGCMDETTDESDWNSEAEGDSWSDDDLWDFTCPLQLQNLSGHVPPHHSVISNGNKPDRTTTVDCVPEVQPLCIINCSESGSGGVARLDDVNSHWNTTMETINIECPRQSKVHFAKEENLETVYIVTDWPDEYQAARVGPWEQFARDAERFQNHIRDIEPILSPCLNPEHRKKVFERIHGNGQS